MFNRKYFRFLILCLILLIQNLFSQIMLQGTVTDNGGEYLGNEAEPVVNALVTVTDQSDVSRSFSATTNEQGQYTIQILPTGVADDPFGTHSKFKLLQNYPNPFNPSTVIGFELSQPCQVTIEIYNVLGQKVKTLLDRFQFSSSQVLWDATDDHNRGVPAGIYIYSVQANNVRINKKMLLIDGQQSYINESSAQGTGSIIEVQCQNILNKCMSSQYTLRITGANIASYEQQNLEITSDLTVDIQVARIVMDIDDNVYQTVKIGNQWWMAENLKVIHYRNGDAIANVTDVTEWINLTTGAYCNYNNDINNGAIYGSLYNWYAVNDDRNIAPEGWHVPSDDELKTLEMVLGISQYNADDIGVRGTDEGGKLKETGTAHWDSPNTGATNESGFTALPGGYRDYDGTYDYIGRHAGFWSSTEYDTYYACGRLLYSYYSAIERSNYIKMCGGSVRCVKD